MDKSSRMGWVVLVSANAFLWFAMAIHRPSTAAPAPAPANPAAQRDAIVAELSEIKRLLREQNQLLRSGNLKFVVAESE